MLLLFTYYPIRFKTIAISILFGAFLASIIAFYDSFILSSPIAYSAGMMQIQAGDIAMDLSMFSLVMSLYFAGCKRYFIMAFCLVATLSALFGRFLSTARGGWIGLPIIVPLILYCFRRILSTKFIFSFIAITLIAIVSVATLPLFKAMQRVYQAQDEITAYFVANNGSTSVGACFDMWKSALLMVKEKPILGWRVEDVGEEKTSRTANY